MVIAGLFPYSLASFKAGFPSNQSGFRQVDRFLYQLMLSRWDDDSQRVREFLLSVFGTGLHVEGYPRPSVERLPGAHPQIDALTELSIAYIDGFHASSPKSAIRQHSVVEPLPTFQQGFGRDMYRFLWSYNKRVPTTLLVDQFIALIAFELAIFTLKLFYALPELAKNPDRLPKAMDARSDETHSQPVIYVDMTGRVSGLSRIMAASCVRRDVAQVDSFMRAIFMIRYLDGTLEKLARNPRLGQMLSAQFEINDTPAYLHGLLRCIEDPTISVHLDAAATTRIDEILEANKPDAEDDVTVSEAQRLVERLYDEGKAPLEQMQELLYVAQQSKTRTNIIGWINAVGGVRKPYGLINGPSDRRTWAYAPTNDLLAVLVQLRAIDYQGWNPAQGANPEPFSLPDFLEWLEARFGIIVDRPPPDLGFDSPEHMAAARENLQAMLRRLRQMGMFEARSDDFSVQELTPPFMAANQPSPAG
jgi:hypothetical protein